MNPKELDPKQREALRREIQMAVDDVERGEYGPLDLWQVWHEVRLELNKRNLAVTEREENR